MKQVQHVSQFIACSPADVYAFASNPANLPQWAAGLARSEVKQDGDAWIVEAPFGRVRIRFADDNAFGVMDHDVALEDGTTFHNPMRVIPNDDGSEIVFTLFRQDDMSDEKFAEDRQAIEEDFRTLKALLEAN
uniref:SRPBCC family protein n=1 Tax=Halomonas sp. TaxID=1486246 RepID=UPI00261A2966|nr:SRPBCC family protein [Halomonas sp.]